MFGLVSHPKYYCIYYKYVITYVFEAAKEKKRALRN